MGWLYGSCFALALALASYLLVAGGPVAETWRRYSAHLDRHFQFLFLDSSPGLWAALHMALCLLFLVLAALLSSLSLALLVPVLAAGPSAQLDRLESQKRQQLAEQLPGWLTILSNNLKSSPNINDALEASVSLVQSPLREEIELLIKEVQLGEHLDRAMHCSGARIRSPLYSSVMTTLMVARQSGGNLPKILSDSASTLREMERLAGVVRTKTAEGKSQTFVLALLPFIVVAALHKVNPTMLPVLVSNLTGKIVLAVSIGLWLGSVALARRIVQVDI